MSTNAEETTVVSNLVIEVENNRPRDFERLPLELKELYHAIYSKIEGMLAGRIIDLKSDLTVVKLIIENSMEAVENFTDGNGQQWTGSEKKEYALLLIGYVINDLHKAGKITTELYEALELTITLFGSQIMDLVIDAVKVVFNVGQRIIQDIDDNGCKGCFRRNC